MWKVIGAIIAVTIIVLFISFNIDHTSNISFIFFTLEQIPVYLTIFFSLLIGAFAMLPFAVGYRRKKKRLNHIEQIEQEINTNFEEKFSGTESKKKRGKKQKKAKTPDIDAATQTPPDKSQ